MKTLGCQLAGPPTAVSPGVESSWADRLTGKTDEGTQIVLVTAPDVTPTQGRDDGAINVWLGPDAASADEQHSFKAEVNVDQAVQECACCYPQGKVAVEEGVRFHARARS